MFSYLSSLLPKRAIYFSPATCPEGDKCGICWGTPEDETSNNPYANHNQNGETHLFHKECLAKWHADKPHPTCPTCQQKLGVTYFKSFKQTLANLKDHVITKISNLSGRELYLNCLMLAGGIFVGTIISDPLSIDSQFIDGTTLATIFAITSLAGVALLDASFEITKTLTVPFGADRPQIHTKKILTATAKIGINRCFSLVSGIGLGLLIGKVFG